jgi:thioester reductase-like protein
MNIYITGSTGFLGKQLVKDLVKTNNTNKLYLPIRKKKGISGKERFKQIFDKYDNKNKLQYIDTTYDIALKNQNSIIPINTHYIILNAYELNFANTIYQVIYNNVKPIMDTINFVKHNLNQLKKIIVISTAYTQPPNMKTSSDLMKINFNPNEMFNKIINKEITWNEIKHICNVPHYTTNTYIFSKILLEHLCVLALDGSNINLSIVRPSQICISTDGTYGVSNVAMAGVRFHCTSMMRTYLSKYSLDIVPVDLVSELISKNITKKQLIIWATSNSQITPYKLGLIVAPKKRNISFRNKSFFFYIFFWIEYMIYTILVMIKLMPQKYFNLWIRFHKDYSYFSVNKFIFPCTIVINEDDYLTTINRFCFENNWK